VRNAQAAGAKVILIVTSSLLTSSIHFDSSIHTPTALITQTTGRALLHAVDEGRSVEGSFTVKLDRSHDGGKGSANTQYKNWQFGSVRHWGEMSRGAWTLTVSDQYTMREESVGVWNKWELLIHGRAVTFQPTTIPSPTPHPTFTPTPVPPPSPFFPEFPGTFTLTGLFDVYSPTDVVEEPLGRGRGMEALLAVSVAVFCVFFVLLFGRFLDYHLDPEGAYSRDHSKEEEKDILNGDEETETSFFEAEEVRDGEKDSEYPYY
jgi:hypothetical protein